MNVFRAAFRRLAPDSVAGRTALAVVFALILTQAVSALIYLTDRGGGPPVHNMRVLSERVAAIVQLFESTPAAERGKVARALDDPVLGVTWRVEPPRFNRFEADGPGPFEFLRRRLHAALGDRGRQRSILIDVKMDHPPLAPPPPAAMEMRDMHPHGDLRIAVSLTDGSWLVFSTGDPPDGPFRLLRFALWMGGVVAVVALLSWWASRRLTAPLARFAAAAERLGLDPEAPELPEDGPRELRAATRAFNAMQGRLARFVADRTQMVAAMSHDLRTPLTRLRLRAELVDDEDMQRRMLADLDEMQAMIDATLAFARDDAKREPRGPLDLAAMLQSLCDDRADAGQAASYDGPLHVTVLGRPVALRRALANLIDNALAYGGSARVTLTADPAGSGGGVTGGVTAEVADDGPGVPPDQLEKVFQPFYRVDASRSRDTGGVGLGLSTARTIVRGHGGDVTLTNRPEGGLTARVVLPG
jgi:signal transduction histidine kinase